VNIIEAINDEKLFAPWFKNRESWGPWLAFLSAMFGLPMTAEQLEIYRKCTDRKDAPSRPSNEAWLVCGRRAGKSFIMAVTAVYLAVFRDYAPFLAPGERATILIIAADRKQARVIMRYISALLKDIPILADVLEREAAESFDLTNRVTIEVGTASYRSTRGYTYVAVLCDELAFWRSEESSSPDVEILNAVRPGMSTIPGAVLIGASSPYARRGALWEAFSRYWGQESAPLVWKAATRTMNPTVPADIIEREYERDPSHAAAEYGADFRTDIENFISIEAVRACVLSNTRERRAQYWCRYQAFVDPSGGSSDSMTLAIAHLEGEKNAKTAVLDVVREVKAPFSPEQVVDEFVQLLRLYRCSNVYGDRYAGEWPREQFRKFGVSYVVSEQTRSDLYLALLPLINSHCVDLLSNERIISQLVSLERRTARSGRDSIDHPPGMHDDLANAVAGAIVRAWQSNASSSPFNSPHNLPKAILGHDGFHRRTEPTKPSLGQSGTGAPPWRN
jgi:hypothetical protein